jgi:hypothetical protein
VKDARFYHPTFRLNRRGGMAPEYLSPRPVEWFKGNWQDQGSGIGIGRGTSTMNRPFRRTVYLRSAELHALSNRALEAGFDSFAKKRAWLAVEVPANISSF